MDHEAYRQESRARWERAASGWAAKGELFQAAALEVSHWLVEAVGPQPGHTVLELAAGPGDTGFLAAELLHPGGVLICTDGAEAMLEVAKARAVELGVRAESVEFKPMELEWIDAKLASIDGVLCRFGYMHAADPEAALRETRRVLRPGGRVALAVWDVAEQNPWLAVPRDALVELGVTELPDDPETPGAFALSAPGHLERLLQDAGFDDIEVEPVPVTFRGADLDELWAAVSALSASLQSALEGLAPADHYALRDKVDAAWAQHVTPDGSFALPGRALCAVAGA